MAYQTYNSLKINHYSEKLRSWSKKEKILGIPIRKDATGMKKLFFMFASLKNAREIFNMVGSNLIFGIEMDRMFSKERVFVEL